MGKTSFEDYLKFCKINGLKPYKYESLKDYYITKEKVKLWVGE